MEIPADKQNNIIVKKSVSQSKASQNESDKENEENVDFNLLDDENYQVFGNDKDVTVEEESDFVIENDIKIITLN